MSGSRRNIAIRMTVEQAEEGRQKVENLRATVEKAFEGMADSASLIGPVLQAAAAASAAFTEAIERQGGTGKAAADNAERLSKAMDSLGGRYDAATAKANELARAEKLHQDVLKAGLTPTEGLTRALEKLRGEYAALGVAASTAAQEQERAMQARFSKLMGVSSSADTSATTTARAKDMEEFGRALDALQAKYDPLYAAQKRYQEGLEEIEQAEKAGVLSAEKAALARTRMSAGLQQAEKDAQQAGKYFGLMGYEIRNVTAQLTDFGVQIASGGGLFYPIIQQGPQLVDALRGPTNALKILGEIFTPARLAALGFFAALTAAGAIAESQERALNRISLALRATRTDYEAAAKEVQEATRILASQPGLSSSDAQGAAQAIASNANFKGTSTQIADLVRQSQNLALVMGTTVPEAAQLLARAMKQPGTVAQELASKDFPGFTAAVAESIRNMELAGDKAGAYAKTQELIQRQSDGASTQTTKLQAAFQALAVTAAQAWEAIKGMAEALGTPLVSALAMALKGVNALLQGVGSVIGALDQFRQWIGENGGVAGQLLAAPDPTQAGAILRNNAIAAAGGTVRPGLTAGAISSTATPQEINAAVLQEAISQGLSPLFQKLAQDIARVESGAQQTRDGKIVTSPTGAQGVMQLMAGTASDMGVDRTDAAGNITGGVKYIAWLQKFLNDLGAKTGAGDLGNDASLVAAAYNAGPGRVQKYLEGKASLPSETIQYVNRTGAQGVLTGMATQYADAEKSLAAYNTRLQQQQEIQARITGLEKDLAAFRAAGESDDSPNIIKTTQALEDQRAALARTSTEQENRIRLFNSEMIVMKQQGEAARALAQAEESAREAARSEGKDASEYVATARAQAQEKLNQALYNTVYEMDRETAQQAKRNAAATDGVAATQAQEIANKAATEALKYGAEGTEEYTNAVQQLTVAYTRQQRVANSASLIQPTRDLEQANDQLRLETSLITANATEREKLIALSKAQQQIKNANAEGTDEAERYLAAVRASAELRSQNQLLQNSWQELQNFGTQAFDRIGEAITQAFVNGEDASVSFKNVAKAVLSEIIQLMLKLSVINPLQNALLGTNNGTLGSLLGMLGGGAGSVAAGGSTYALDMSSGVTTATAGAGLSGSISKLTDAVSGVGKLFGGSGGFKTGIGFLDNTKLVGNLSTTASLQAGLGIAGGAYGIYSGIQTGGAKGAAQGVAGAAGLAGGASTLLGGLGVAGLGAVSTVAPYVAVAASIASLFLGGQKPSDKTGTSTLNFLTGEQVEGGLGGKRYDQANRNEAASIAASGWQIQDQYKSLMGLDQNIPLAYQISVGNRDGIGLRIGDTTQKFSRDEQGAQNLAKALSVAIIQAGASIASNEVKTVVQNSGGDVDTITANLQWYQNTYKKLIEDSTEDTGSFAQSLASLKAPYEEAMDKAASLGLGTQALADKMAEAAQTLYDERDRQVAALRTAYDARYDSATTGNTLDYQLRSFDTDAAQQIQELRDKLKDLGFTAGEANDKFGEQINLERALAAERQSVIDAYRLSSLQNTASLADRQGVATGYNSTLEGQLASFDRQAEIERIQAARDGVSDMAQVEKTLALERLKVIQDFAEQAAATEKAAADARQQAIDYAQKQAANALGGIADYVTSLQRGDASTLTPEQKLQLARDQFNAVAGSAAAGDYTSVTKFTDYAQAYQEAANAYGAGPGQAEAVQRILEAAQQVSTVNVEALTASTMASIQQQATATLMTGLQLIADRVATLIDATERARVDANNIGRLAA